MIRILSNPPAARAPAPLPCIKIGSDPVPRARATARCSPPGRIAQGAGDVSSTASPAVLSEPATCSTCPRWVPCKVAVVGICTRDDPAVKTIASHGCVMHPRAHNQL